MRANCAQSDTAGVTAPGGRCPMTAHWFAVSGLAFLGVLLVAVGAAAVVTVFVAGDESGTDDEASA